MVVKGSEMKHDMHDDEMKENSTMPCRLLGLINAEYTIEGSAHGRERDDLRRAVTSLRRRIPGSIASPGRCALWRGCSRLRPFL